MLEAIIWMIASNYDVACVGPEDVGQRVPQVEVAVGAGEDDHREPSDLGHRWRAA